MKLATGLQLGQLTLQARVSAGVWVCVCTCGTTCEKSSESLYQWKNRALSCGCAMYQYAIGASSYKWKGYGEISSKLWHRYQSNARVRSIGFKLSIQEAWMLFEDQPA